MELIMQFCCRDIKKGKPQSMAYLPLEEEIKEDVNRGNLTNTEMNVTFCAAPRSRTAPKARNLCVGRCQLRTEQGFQQLELV